MVGKNEAVYTPAVTAGQSDFKIRPVSRHRIMLSTTRPEVSLRQAVSLVQSIEVVLVPLHPTNDRRSSAPQRTTYG